MIRDSAVVTNNRGFRRKLGLQMYGRFGLIVLIIGVAGIFDWSPIATASVCAVLSNLHNLLDRIILRTRGHIDYIPSYTIPQKLLVGLAAVSSILLSWIGFRTYLSIAYRGSAWPINNLWAQWTVVLCSFALVFAMNGLLHRITASVAAPNFAQATDVSSVLLLRSFSDDRLRMRNPVHADPILGMLATRPTFERCLAYFLIGNGNLIAIGKPGERLPRLGALRTYWPDNQWQEAVRKTASLTQAVILIAGSTHGLAWEVQQLRGLGLLPKTIFVVPPLRRAAAVQRLEQLLNDLDAPESAFTHVNECITSTVTAVHLAADGRVVIYLSDGRDWNGYFGTITYFLGELAGSITPPAAGRIAKTYLGDSTSGI